MTDLEQSEMIRLKGFFKVRLNEACDWVYSEHERGIADEVSNFADHISPMIEECLDKAFQLGVKQDK